MNAITPDSPQTSTIRRTKAGKPAKRPGPAPVEHGLPGPPPTREEFIALGTEIYGPNFRNAVALRLGIAPRTFSRYCADPSTLPEGTYLAMVLLSLDPSLR